MEDMDTGSEAVTTSPAAARSRPPLLPLCPTPGHLIRRAQQVHTAIWAEYMRTEVTGPQYGVLASLAQESLIDQTRLGALASLDKNNVADIVSRLTARAGTRQSPELRT